MTGACRMPINEIEIHLDKLKAATCPAFFPLYKARERFLVMVGGAGSGKSHFAAQKIIKRCMQEHHHFGAFRKVHRTIKLSAFAQLQGAIAQFGVGPLWKPNKTDLSLRFIPNGSQISCFGMDDPEKLKSIYGLTDAWCEEATEFSEADLNQINLRVRGKSDAYKQIMLSFNPVSVLSPLKKRYFDVQDPGRIRVFHSTFRDNPFIDAEYKRELENLKHTDPDLWRIYGEGLWGVISDLIYPGFICEPWPERLEEFGPDELFYGLDFGYRHPTALIECAMLDNEIYMTEKIYASGLTNPMLIEEMIEQGISFEAPIYADAAEPGRIEEIRKAGFNVFPADKGPGSVLGGIVLVKGLRVHTKPENVNLNNEAQTYKWATRKDGSKLDAPVPFDDHAMDAMRYALWTHLRARIGGESVLIDDLIEKARRSGDYSLPMLPGED